MESVFSILLILFITFAMVKRAKSSSKDIAEARDKAEKNARALSKSNNVDIGSGRVPTPSQVKKQWAQAGYPNSSANVPAPARKAPVSSYDAEVGSGGMKISSRDSLSIKDDRSNDWLARQMRYEKQSLGKLNDMFSFVIHKNNGCDAELLREFHHTNCSAEGIDTARGH